MVSLSNATYLRPSYYAVLVARCSNIYCTKCKMIGTGMTCLLVDCHRDRMLDRRAEHAHVASGAPSNPKLWKL